MSDIPKAADVVRHLNDRLQFRGLPYRVRYLEVLPYMNPMWMANWDIPQLHDAPERDVIADELREARWQYPQVIDEY